MQLTVWQCSECGRTLREEQIRKMSPALCLEHVYVCQEFPDCVEFVENCHSPFRCYDGEFIECETCREPRQFLRAKKESII